MTEHGLASGIPLGPFEGTPIYAYAGSGKNARLHARDSCSSLRTPAPLYFAVTLDSAALSRMCQSCARWEQWGRPGTAVGIFLSTLTGLIDELDRYTAEDLEEDLNGRDVAKAAGLLARGDWPDEEDDGEAWDDYREARFLRDDLLLPFWRRAAESIYTASGAISRYPWLRDWAGRRLAAKASYAEELRRQLGQFINPGALLDAAAAYFLPSPELPVNDSGFAAFGDPGRIRAVLQQTWRQWQRDSADSWLPLGAKDWRVHSVLDSALGRKRKGRDEARQALSNLYQMWARDARRTADKQESSRLVAVLIPETRRLEDPYGSDDTGFDRILVWWQLGVIAVHTMAADWGHRAVLLNVPGLIGRRLGDLDLAVTVVRRETDGDRYVDRVLRYARASGRNLGIFIEQLMWSARELRMILKNRYPAISITNEEVGKLTDRFKIVYRVGEDPLAIQPPPDAVIQY